MCYRPCMFFSCVSCLSFSYFLIGYFSPPLFPTSVPRFLPSILYVPCSVPSYCCSCFLVLFSLNISFDVGLDGTSFVAVLVPRSRYYEPTGSPTCVAAAVGTWSAIVAALFGCSHGRSPSRCPSRKKTEQRRRAVCMGRQLPVFVRRLAQQWLTLVNRRIY